MADIREWIKGISFFLFVTLMFYFLWTNIFSNIIEFVGSDIFGIGSEANTSISILKALAWVSFAFLYLSTGFLYLIYSIVNGANTQTKTKPLEFLKAIGIWAVMMPFLTFIYGMLHFLLSVMNSADIMDAGMETTATQFSWILGIIILLALTIIPFVFVLKGYGFDVTGKNQKT